MQPPEKPESPEGTALPERTETVRLGELSLPARLIISLAVGILVVFTGWHLATVFLFVAPENTISEEYDSVIRDYVYPEFEQNWKLFAPNPLQRNVAVQVRVEIRQDDGSRGTTDWIDLTAIDREHILHHPLPSHTAQNELRRAWDFYTNSHDDENQSTGLRGQLSESYVHRIALLRLGQDMDLATIDRIQLRSATTRLPAPPWSDEDIDTETVYHELDWWVVTTRDLPGGALAQRGERS